MQLTAGGKWYRRLQIYIQGPKGLVKVPFVLLADGHPGYVINQWIFSLIEEQMGAVKLDQYVRALEHLYSFTMARYVGGPISRDRQECLVADFIMAKRHGTDSFCTVGMPNLQYLKNLGLNWEQTTDDTIEVYIAAINYFDDWQSTFHGAERLNPSEIRFMNAWEIYQEYKIRANFDPLFHLHPSRAHEKEKRKTQVTPQSRRRLFPIKRKTAKGFPMGHLLKLFSCARNPRDELLILLMSGASLRMSEPLHIFRSDIESMSEWGELKVRLDNPVTGQVEWTVGKKRFHGERQAYFKQVWSNEDLPFTHPLRGLRPRVDYLNDSLQAGWKGMTFGESDGANAFGTDPLDRPYDVHYARWLDPRIGSRAQLSYEAYRDRCLLCNYNTGKLMPQGWLRHPWLFINLTPEYYGMPLSYKALKNIWDRLLDRLASEYGIDLREKGLGWHSLRHFYGWYCASVLGYTLDLTSIFMHHASTESTRVYYTLSKIKARNEITKKLLESLGYKIEDIDLLITPDTLRLEFPEDWMNQQFHRQLLETKYKMKLQVRAT